jgi:hypothetical protein
MQTEILDKPLKQLELSERTGNSLLRDGITTLRQVMEMRESELLRVPNFGRKSLNEINAFLKHNGFTTLTQYPHGYEAIKIPLDVIRELRTTASEDGRSVDDYAIDLLREVLGMTPRKPSVLARLDKLEKLLATMAHNNA